MIAASLFATLAAALPAGQLLLGVVPGDPREALARADLQAKTEARAVDRQALAQYLVRTRFLETLNRFALAPVDEEGELDARAFEHLVRGTRAGREYVLASAGNKVKLVFARVPVPVDPERDREVGGSPDRLHRLKETLRAIANEGFAIAPKEKDRWGNVFVWTGRGRSGLKIVVWYVPELDELRVLVH